MGPAGFLLWVAAAFATVVFCAVYCTCVTCRGFTCTKLAGHTVVFAVAGIAVIRFLQLNFDYLAGSRLYGAHTHGGL